jgi:predicted secreted hydrolase
VNPLRRRWLGALPLWVGAAQSGLAADDDDGVRRGRPITLPRDHGMHPATRTEWWYATGWIGQPAQPSHGYQVTFFRNRTGLAQDLPGRLAPRHLLFAHAAVTDLGSGRHLHDQRIVRWSGDVDPSGVPQRAGAASGDTRVWLGAWTLQRGDDGYSARIDAGGGGNEGWSLQLRLQPTQPVLLQGDAGFSRKGPEERQASHYYSVPQLSARATIVSGGGRAEGAGQAWLDHEWSDEILATDAVGWDWIGFNGFDGSALMAFQLRRADGSAVWAGGSHRGAGGPTRDFSPAEVRWSPGRRWHSGATGADYPVDWQLETPAGRFRVRTLLDTQELDGRGSTGTVYWEGLSELLDSSGRRIGLGYLEMTGYAGRLRL